MLGIQTLQCTSPAPSKGQTRMRGEHGARKWVTSHPISCLPEEMVLHPSLTDGRLVLRAENCLLKRQFDWFALTFWASNQRCRDKSHTLAFQREEKNNNSNNNNIIAKIHWASTKCQVLAGYFPDLISSHAHSNLKWQAWFYLLWRNLGLRKALHSQAFSPLTGLPLHSQACPTTCMRWFM